MSEVEGTAGRLLADRYRLDGVLGKGGMGTVWRATDETLGRTVAVKELRFPGNVDDEEKRRLVTRTLREAKATARIRNTGAITVFDVVKEDDRPWIVMELIEGRSLSDRIREDGPLTPRRAAEVGLVVLEVLSAAHREGILHRDVKPSNVLIADDGRVVLSDFGIAQIDGDPSVTSTGMLVGAPSYISPERARGHKPGPPADLWSLGALLYAAVEGRPPYDKGSAIATLTAVMTEPVPPMPNAGRLAPAIAGLLIKDPDKRLAEPAARALLEQVANAPEPPVAAPRISSGETGTTLLPVNAADAAPAAGAQAAQGVQPAPDLERAREALRAVRRAAARPVPKPRPAPEHGSPADAPPPARASLGDVLPRRRLGIIAVAVLAVLAALIGVLIATSGGGDGGGSGSGAGSKGDTKNGTTAGAGSHGKGAATTTAAPAATTAARGGDDQGDDHGGGKGKGKGKGGGDDQGTTEDTALTAPAGFQLVTAKGGAILAIPATWKRLPDTNYATGTYYGGPDGSRLMVDYTRTPGPSALADWQKKAAHNTIPGYRTIGVRSVDYRTYDAADWEYKRTNGGKQEHVLNRGMVTDPGHGYALLFTTPAEDWNSAANVHVRDVVFATFKPAE